MARHAAACPSTIGCASSAQTLPEAPTLLSLDRRDRGDFLRYFYRRYEGAPRRPDRRRRRRAVQPADPHQELPGRHPPGARAPRPRPSHGADHRRARLRRRAAAAAVRRDRLRRDVGQARRHLHRRAHRRAAHRRGPGPVLADYADADGRARGVGRLRRLDERPAHARGRRLPRRGEPRDRLAALARKRGWLVEHWAKAPGGPRPLLPIGPPRHERTSGRR